MNISVQYINLRRKYGRTNVLFVWVDALPPQSTAEVMSGWSVSLSTLFLGKPPEAGNQYLAHILSPLTDNCSS